MENESIVRERAMEMAFTRRRLAESTAERRRAVCTFPLVVGSIAHDMRRIMDCSDRSGNESAETENALVYMESQIREAYRTYFGTELGQ